MPGVGVGVFLLAVGAILTFAVSAEAEGFSINTIGVILMAAGGFTILLSLLFWSTWFGTKDGTVREHHTTHAH